MQQRRSRLWIAVVAIAAGGVAVCLCLPFSMRGHGTAYACSGTPVSELLHPAREAGRRVFFDQGHTCNQDAHAAADQALLIALVGAAGATACFFLVKRDADGAPEDPGAPAGPHSTPAVGPPGPTG